MKKVLLTTVMSLMMCLGVYAQVYEWKKPPKPTEIEIGIVTGKFGAGTLMYKGKTDKIVSDDRKNLSDEEVYELLLHSARQEYGKDYPNLILRNFQSKLEEENGGSYYGIDNLDRYYKASATVVIPDTKVEAYEKLSQAIVKALRNVREGSRMAIDQVTVVDGKNKEDFKDQIIDALLDNGYKVVAKEYLDRLYEEQQNQQSGIYNERTTVQENNFSAVGYYINVKVTETSIRVQVVNVSTGEYEGNSTINF